MEYNKLIAELHTGDDVEGFYVLKDAFLKTTAAGKPFLSGVLADRSGVIDLKVWDYSGPIGARPDDIGRVVKIRGQVSEFKGAPQLTAGRIRMADGNDQYDLSALVPTAPIDADARVAEIERMIDSMEDRSISPSPARCLRGIWTRSVPSRRPRASTTAFCPGFSCTRPICCGWRIFWPGFTGRSSTGACC